VAPKRDRSRSAASRGLVRLDSAGNTIAAHDHGVGFGRALAVQGERMAITGLAVDAIDFGDGPKTGSGHEDAFVALMSPWATESK